MVRAYRTLISSAALWCCETQPLTQPTQPMVNTNAGYLKIRFYEWCIVQRRRNFRSIEKTVIDKSMHGWIDGWMAARPSVFGRKGRIFFENKGHSGNTTRHWNILQPLLLLFVTVSLIPGNQNSWLLDYETVLHK